MSRSTPAWPTVDREVSKAFSKFRVGGLQGPPRGLLSARRIFGNRKAGRSPERPRQARLLGRQLEGADKILPANRQPFVIAQGQFAPDAEQFRSVPLAFIKVDLRSFEDIERLPRPAGGGRASREFCLQ